MENSFQKMMRGYRRFRQKYATGNDSVMQQLAYHGQKPEVMVLSCCDSRVDPALILQCEPGDLFIARNVANIVPPYEHRDGHHGTSAALEFGICYLHVKHLIILGHSQCGGIEALLNKKNFQHNDFVTSWVSHIKTNSATSQNNNELSKQALLSSYNNCHTFPWIEKSLKEKKLVIHLWFFDVKQGEIFDYSFEDKQYHRLSDDIIAK